MDPARLRSARVQLTLLAVALAVGYSAYRLLHRQDLDSTALLFIGLPAILAIVVALTPPARSITGMTMKGITLGLLLSGVLLIEGVVCIVLAAPLFYAVGLAVAWGLERARRVGNRTDPRAFALLAVLAVLSTEGVWPATTAQRAQEVTAVRVVDSAAGAVEAALAAAPVFAEPLPALLRSGYPRPVDAYGSGLAPGAERVVAFGGRHPGTLRLEVAERSPGRVLFRATQDSTPIAGWVTWREAEVRWHEEAPGRTRITWTLRFDRRLDPSWYFAPIQRLTAGQAAGYLIDTLATPR